MRRIMMMVSASVVTLLLASCADDDGGGRPGGSPTSGEQAGTLTVQTSYQAGKGGAMYIEGALADVILRDESGTEVDTQTKSPGDPIRFEDLAPGSYTLEPALRPCDGNCGYLDGRTDDCTQTIEIDGDVEVKVAFTVGVPCEVRPL
jgi:hypothetical protein